MKSTASRQGVRIGMVAVAVAVAVAFSVSACIQSPSTPRSTPATNTSSSAMPTNSPTPTARATPTPRRYTVDCGTLLTDAQVYEYNPNYVVDPGYAPKPGSIPAAIAANLGQTCGWIDETSGTELEVAIAAPTAAALASAKTAASGGTAISTAGNHGFFAVKNGVGSAQFFYDSLWLDVSSPDFATAADAQALYPIIVKNQRTTGG